MDRQKEIVFVADFFADQLPRGAEQNDAAVIHILKSDGWKIECIRSAFLTDINSQKFYIIGNFWQLSETIKSLLAYHKNYMIYEHDYKFVANRNPALYPDMTVPREEIINLLFYLNAQKIVCLTHPHRDIFIRTINHSNISIIGSSVWSTDDFTLMALMERPGPTGASVLSPKEIWQKGGDAAIAYCKENDLPYTVIDSCKSRGEFLTRFSRNPYFVFFPTVPETCSRIAVEAKMMGMEVITNDLVAAKGEEWWKYKDLRLIDHLQNTQLYRVLTAFDLKGIE